MIKSDSADLSLKMLFDMNLDRVRFETEKTFFTTDGKKRYIDVYGESDELVIVIENKVKARENMNGTDIGQTKDYRDYVEEHLKNGQKVVCLFITPDPKQKPYDKQDDQCYMLLLDDDKKPYFNSKGEKIGYYKACSQAGVDAINLYRKRNNIEARLETLNGPVYWKTKEGVTIKSLIDSLDRKSTRLNSSHAR